MFTKEEGKETVQITNLSPRYPPDVAAVYCAPLTSAGL